MKEELNIAAILKEKPSGTKLWSPIFGDCVLNHLTDSGIGVFPTYNGYTSKEEKSFFNSGKYTLAGEVCLFPSKKMQDWSKFAWKKGDVLSDISDIRVLFVGWVTDNYTKFKCKMTSDLSMEESCDTRDFISVSDDEAKKTIKKIEEHYGGKLNLETLQIEHPKQEFKDGDVVVMERNQTFAKSIIIFKELHCTDIEYYAFINCSSHHVFCNDNNYIPIDGRNIRLATEEEKQQLFSALEKEGKRWNPDTKTIEDLHKKYEFKPMDWCLMRDIDEVEYHNAITSEWVLCQFSHYLDDFKVVAVGGNWHSQCIPYNDQTAHLLGTTEEWK